nr:PilZ domain-containing protein [Altericroceibacterium indicum]
MPDGDCFDIEPVWTEGNCAGFRFLKPIDVKAIISSHKDHPKRGLRVNLSHDAYIVHLGHTIRVRLVNLSQQGACIICDEFLAMDERIDLYFDYLSEIKCTVRWRKEPHYGVCFGRTLAFAELATIVAAINHDEALHHPQADSNR